MFDNKEGNSFRNPPSNPISAKISGCSKLNFRKTAEVSDKNIIDTIAEGTVVSVLDKGFGDWTFISYGDKNGYVMSKFLKDVV